MHWGGRYMQGLGVNALMPAATDPISRQPELKHAAVQVEKFATAWQLVAFPSMTQPGCLHAALQPWLARFDHADADARRARIPMVVLRAWGAAAAPAPPSDARWPNWQRATVASIHPHTLAFDDARRGIAKRALIEATA